jgi:hypothetical protein
MLKSGYMETSVARPKLRDDKKRPPFTLAGQSRRNNVSGDPVETGASQYDPISS